MARRGVAPPALPHPLEGISVDPHTEPSLAQQLADQLRWRLATQQLRPGQMLPPARSLAKGLGIHLHTVRAAYHLLAADGLVEVHRGRGTRVLPHSPAALTAPGTSPTHTVAVILPSITNPFYHLLLEGIEAAAEVDGTLLFVCLTHDDPAQAERHARQVIASRVDGILVAAHDLSAVLGAPAPLPLVTLDHPEAPSPAVNLDLQAAGRQATLHLTDHGHQRIACVMAGAPNTLALQVGYQNALAERGIQPDPALVVVTPDFRPDSGRWALQQLLAVSPIPSAVFVGADFLAIGLLQAAAESGCRIPEDLALVSFNDIPSAAYLSPPLTTVAAPARQMGEEAMCLLRAQLQGERMEHRIICLPCNLVIRRSCGCTQAEACG